MRKICVISFAAIVSVAGTVGEAWAQIVEPTPTMERIRKSKVRGFAEPDSSEIVLIREAFRMFGLLKKHQWPNMLSVFPTTTLLLTNDSQYLFGHPAPPEEYFLTGQKNRVFKHVYGVDRTDMPCEGAVTRPLYGAPTIVIASRECTGQNATAWMFDYVKSAFRLYSFKENELLRISRANLPFPDPEQRWKAEFPFPYRDPDVIAAFNDLALTVVETFFQQYPDKKKAALDGYLSKRTRLQEALDAADTGEHSSDEFFRYITWSEGLAHYAAYYAMKKIRHPKKTVRSVEGWQPYTTYCKVDLRRSFLKLKTEPVTDELTLDHIVRLGALTAGIIDHYVPDWKEFVMNQDMWLEDLMAGARMEAQ